MSSEPTEASIQKRQPTRAVALGCGDAGSLSNLPDFAGGVLTKGFICDRDAYRFSLVASSDKCSSATGNAFKKKNAKGLWEIQARVPSGITQRHPGTESIMSYQQRPCGRYSPYLGRQVTRWFSRKK
jgi:hypothetical protein